MKVMVKLPNLFKRAKPANAVEEEMASHEAEIARNLWKQHRILPPSSPARDQWNQFMMLLVIYNCFQIPLSLSISFNQDAKDGFDYFDIFVDSLFWIDMFLNFRTTFIEDEVMCHDQKLIAKKYLKGWFPIDFFAVFPWQYLGDLRFMKIVKVFRCAGATSATGVARRLPRLPPPLIWWRRGGRRPGRSLPSPRGPRATLRPS